MADYLRERVTLNRETPERDYADRIAWQLKESGVVITGDVTRAVLTLTEADTEAVVVIDSDTEGWGTNQPFAYDSGVLSFDLSGASGLVAGIYTAQVDVYAGDRWYPWGRTQDIRITVEA